MAPAAYLGLAGEAVSVIAPYTEADRIALHLHFLASFGNAVGRGPHYLVEATSHFANLFLVTIGRTSRARKGTGADWISRIFEIADPHWAHACIHSGMSSGEGMLTPIRDRVYAMRKGVEELIDPGVEDKRMLLDEREFSQVLRVMRREGNVVSRMVRDAWDCREVIGTLTKHNRTKVTKASCSIRPKCLTGSPTASCWLACAGFSYCRMVGHLQPSSSRNWGKRRCRPSKPRGPSNA